VFVVPIRVRLCLLKLGIAIDDDDDDDDDDETAAATTNGFE